MVAVLGLGVLGSPGVRRRFEHRTRVAAGSTKSEGADSSVPPTGLDGNFFHDI
jgi:hypothetical protein